MPEASVSTAQSPPVADEPSPPARPRPKKKATLFERLEAFVSRLSTRNNFWHRVCSLFWLPYAFRSGIRMKRIDSSTFTAILPFRKFNRNWYNAMAGAALLGNSEIAGGMYVFGRCGGDYTVVCKHLEYKFLRPCLGPAVYRITPREDLDALIATGEEFNITLELDVVQGLPTLEHPKPVEGEDEEAEGDADAAVKPSKRPIAREKRVGRCVAVFHVTPKVHQKAKGRLSK